MTMLVESVSSQIAMAATPAKPSRSHDRRPMEANGRGTSSSQFVDVRRGVTYTSLPGSVSVYAWILRCWKAATMAITPKMVANRPQTQMNDSMKF